jgi:aerobic-type carbon monoxide dehydrogenase small subunit (CoxS/CutS family)
MVFNISVHCGIILVLPDGTPVSEEPHACIPPSLLWEIHDLVTIDGMTRKEAILHVRSKLRHFYTAFAALLEHFYFDIW